MNFYSTYNIKSVSNSLTKFIEAIAKIQKFGNFVMMNRKIFGLIGRKLGHSWSARYFNDRFERENINAEYRNFEMDDPLAELPELIDRLPQLSGLNVTIPYKQTVMELLDAVSQEASEIGAVNVIGIDRSGDRPFLTGYNTDVIGFRETIRPLLADAGISEGNALVLGSGGASRAVCYALKQLGLAPVIVSRHPAAGQIGYDSVTPEQMETHRVIVNTTPAGMYPDTGTMPPLDPDLTGSGNVVYDLIYNPDPTRWLERCAVNGATVCGGLGMLYRQADEAWKIWNNE